MDQFLVAQATGLDEGLKGAVLTVVWIVAIGLGIWEYSRSKGRIGRALMVTLGGGLLITFVVEPGIITQKVPAFFSSVLDWVFSFVK